MFGTPPARRQGISHIHPRRLRGLQYRLRTEHGECSRPSGHRSVEILGIEGPRIEHYSVFRLETFDWQSETDTGHLSGANPLIYRTDDFNSCGSVRHAGEACSHRRCRDIRVVRTPSFHVPNCARVCNSPKVKPVCRRINRLRAKRCPVPFLRLPTTCPQFARLLFLLILPDPIALFPQLPGQLHFHELSKFVGHGVEMRKELGAQPHPETAYESSRLMTSQVVF